MSDDLKQKLFCVHHVMIGTCQKKVKEKVYRIYDDQIV